MARSEGESEAKRNSISAELISCGVYWHGVSLQALLKIVAIGVDNNVRGYGGKWCKAQ